MPFHFKLILVIGVIVLAWFTGGFFNESAVCTHCGALRQTNRVLWIPIRETKPTALSTYLNSLPGGDPQNHQWMFTGGHGGPIRCALGGGRNLIMPVQRTEIVEALKSIRQHRGEADFRKWTARILDPKSVTDAYFSLFGLINSSDDFDSSYTTANEEFTTSQDSHAH